MADRRLRAILEFMTTGEGRVINAVKGLDSATAKASTQQGVMAQRSKLLSQAQQKLSQRVLAGNLSVDKAAAIYQRYERSLPTQALEGLEKQTSNTQTGLQRVQAAFGKVAVGAAAAGAAIYTAKKVFDFAKEGAQILQVEDSFNRMNETVFKTPGLLEDMRKSVRGTIGDTQLMAGVLTLVAGTSDEMAQSLAQGAPKLLEIAKAAQKLNPTLGDTAFLYQSLSLGIKRQSKLIIDNLGLNVSIGAANERYAKSLGKTVEQLSDAERFQAFYNEVLQAGDKLIAQVGGNVDSLTDSYEATTVALKTYVEEAKKGLAQTLYNNVIGLKDTEQRWNDLRGALIKSGASWGNINDIVDDGRAKLDLWRTEADLERDLKANERGISRMAFAIQALNLGLEIGTDAFEDYITAQMASGRATEQQVDAALNYAEAQRSIEERLKSLKRAVDDGTISQQQFDSIYRDTGFTTELNEQALSELETQVYQTTRAQEQLRLEGEMIARLMSNEIAPALYLTDKALEANEENWLTLQNAMSGTGQVATNLNEALRPLRENIAGQAGAFNDVVDGGLTFFKEELDNLGPIITTIGGRTADQNSILADARAEYKKLGAEISRMTAAPELYGLTIEEAAEKIGEMTERQGELLPVISRMESITGSAAMAIREGTVDFEALNTALFDGVRLMAQDTSELERLGITAFDAQGAIVAMGLATGELNEEQAEAILKEIELREAVRLVSAAYLEGTLSADEAKEALLGVGSGAIDSADDLQILIDKAIEAKERLEAFAGTYKATVVTEYTYQGAVDVDLVSQHGYAGRRQHGGPVSAGKAYIVGERGPELFVSDTPGRILPAGQTQTLIQSGGNVTMNIDARGATNPAVNDIEAAVRRGLLKAGLQADSIRRRR